MMRLWSGVEDPKNRTLKHYDKHEYQGINIFMLKNLKVKKKVKIRVVPKFLFLGQKYIVKGIRF